MSAMGRSTVSPAKVRVVLACLGLAVLAGLILGVTRAPADPPLSEQPVAPSPAAVPEVPEPPSDPDSASDAEPEPASGAVTAGGAGPSEQDTVDAQQAAADFAAAYATYSYDDPPAAAIERVRSFVTTEFAAELARTSGATAGREELAERQQRAAGSVFTVQTTSAGEGYADVLVVVRQEVTLLDRAETRWPTYLLRVTHTDAGWRVAGLLR
jgi:hypothetical protein